MDRSSSIFLKFISSIVPDINGLIVIGQILGISTNSLTFTVSNLRRMYEWPTVDQLTASLICLVKSVLLIYIYNITIVTKAVIL